MKNNLEIIIDKEFYSLIDFVKGKSELELQDSILRNFTYVANTSKPTFNSIANFYNKIKLWGEINLENKTYDLIINNATTFANNLDDIIWLYNNLEDFRSKKIVNTILYYWFLLDYKKVNTISDGFFPQYFDLDLVSCTSDEVFVDIGSYIGDTLVSYCKMFGINSYKNFYCYEISPENVNYINQNIERFNLEKVILRQKGASNKEGKLFLSNNDASSTTQLVEDGTISVDLTTIDKDILEDVTFIKMDIEGGEKDALLGCLEKIKSSHPKLALSAYHNNDHLFSLAKIIKQVDPSYKLYFRYYGGPLLPTEYILYAI